MKPEIKVGDFVEVHPALTVPLSHGYWFGNVLEVVDLREFNGRMAGLLAPIEADGTLVPDPHRCYFYLTDLTKIEEGGM